MEAFTTLKGLVVPLDRPNVDTDAIIPKQFLKSIKRSGFGPNLFDEWRYLDQGQPGQDSTNRPLNPDFVLNQDRYQGAQIMLGRDNFGCGSSREHAPWAFYDYGISCIIAPSFADIFYSNSFKNGILLIKLDSETIDQLFKEVEITSGYKLEIDLASQSINTPSGEEIKFDVDESLKHRLLNGLDDIGLTLQHANEIKAYEQNRNKLTPWLFNQ
ncbi:MAG: 3-isopropylmalate dehydratase small subunit [Gammaproteobacteria bacterium]